MSWVIAVFVVLLIIGLTGCFTVNAFRIMRHMNKSLNAFRTRLEDEANSVLDGLFNANHGDDRRPPHSANGSQPTSSD
jgi:hypothetical protein